MTKVLPQLTAAELGNLFVIDGLIPDELAVLPLTVF
jgi:hypothetical protein